MGPAPVYVARLRYQDSYSPAAVLRQIPTWETYQTTSAQVYECPRPGDWE